MVDYHQQVQSCVPFIRAANKASNINPPVLHWNLQLHRQENQEKQDSNNCFNLFFNSFRRNFDKGLDRAYFFLEVCCPVYSKNLSIICLSSDDGSPTFQTKQTLEVASFSLIFASFWKAHLSQQQRLIETAFYKFIKILNLFIILFPQAIV